MVPSQTKTTWRLNHDNFSGEVPQTQNKTRTIKPMQNLVECHDYFWHHRCEQNKIMPLCAKGGTPPTPKVNKQMEEPNTDGRKVLEDLDKSTKDSLNYGRHHPQITPRKLVFNQVFSTTLVHIQRHPDKYPLLKPSSKYQNVDLSWSSECYQTNSSLWL